MLLIYLGKSDELLLRRLQFVVPIQQLVFDAPEILQVHIGARLGPALPTWS